MTSRRENKGSNHNHRTVVRLRNRKRTQMQKASRRANRGLRYNGSSR